MHFKNNLFYYLSDLHIEKGFQRVININKNLRERPYLILSGDIGYVNEKNYQDFLYGISTRFDKVFIVAGNHEYKNNTKSIEEINVDIQDICNGKNNLIFLQQKTFKICETRNIILAGCTLWSNLPKSRRKYHLQDKKWLHNILENDTINNYVFITHHSPILPNLKIRKNTHYFSSNQTGLLKKNNLIMWIHGHNHINKDIIMYNTLITTNQYGSYKDPQKGFNEYK
jgi:hypothetical protein